MRISFLAALLPLFPSIYSSGLQPRDHETHDYYALHIHPSHSPSQVAAHLRLEVEGPLGHLEDHYLFRTRRGSHDVVRDVVQQHRRLKRRRDLNYHNDVLDSVLFAQKQKLRPPHEKRGPVYAWNAPQPRQGVEGEGELEVVQPSDQDRARAKGIEIAETLDIQDPIFHNQWHLYNSEQIGHDLNVTGVWMQNITGKGTYVAIVDDGLDMDSDDLKDNYYAEGSYDFNEKTNEPRPRLSDDRHGTRCAGEVSAGRNNVCGVGVAYDSKIAGLRILSKPITDADEAVAMTYGYETTQIYSCSWGPPDDGQQMGAPGLLIKRAMLTGIQKGRAGLGTIYVFAAGNGAAADDNCNFDGYTNSIYSVTVGAIDSNGNHPYYSEKGSAQLIVTYSSGGSTNSGIQTTDVGKDTCYANHGGTSAAGPLAVGIFALVLEARPDLTWRDLQWLTVMTAIPVHEEDEDWQETPLGRKYSHQYGYGKLDAYRIVEAAKQFVSRKPQAWYFSPWQHIRHAIPEGAKGLASTFVVSKDALADANFELLEHVTVTMNVEHTRRGDLSVELRSPSGIVSHLSTARRRDSAPEGYVDWTFMSVAHWGESGEGAWTIIVKDTVENEFNGTFVDWKLNLFGECSDPSIQGLLPLPEENDDDDHDREEGAVGTTSIIVPSTTALPPGNPTDHVDRPINQKPPGDADDSEDLFDDVPQVTPIDVFTTTVSFQAPSAAPDSSYSVPIVSPTARPDNFLPSPFPTFGVSKRTQVWIYGAVALIVIFCTSLAVYLFMARRKRLRNFARENYEFEILDDHDEEGEKQASGRRGGKRAKRRAGELYDAFAGESDEEIFSEEEDGLYRDQADEKRRKQDSEDDGSGGSGTVRRYK